MFELLEIWKRYFSEMGATVCICPKGEYLILYNDMQFNIEDRDDFLDFCHYLEIEDRLTKPLLIDKND